jgi:hypothetical protein
VKSYQLCGILPIDRARTRDTCSQQRRANNHKHRTSQGFTGDGQSINADATHNDFPPSFQIPAANPPPRLVHELLARQFTLFRALLSALSQ